VWESQASMNCDMGVGNRPNGQHGGLNHRFSLRRVIPAKGVAKDCVANFAFDRRRIGTSGSRQIDAVRIEKALLLPPLDRQDQDRKTAPGRKIPAVRRMRNVKIEER
jgi:hypothetical protein